MGIPISASERKVWIDPAVDPADGATYYFSYLTGERQEEFLALQAETMSAVKSALPEARRQINADPKYKSASAKKKAELIAARADELAQENLGRNKNSTLAYSRKLIDIFLTGWEGKDFPPFPKDGHPSRMLRLGDLNRISSAISGMLNELYGLSIVEAKN